MKLCVEVDAKDEYYINEFKDVNCTYQRDSVDVVREIIQAGVAAQPDITRIAKYTHDSEYETGIHFTTVVTPDFVSDDDTQIDCAGEVSLYQITSAPTSSPSSSPTDVPTASPTGAPAWNDLYEIKTSDRCQNVITTASECLQAFVGMETDLINVKYYWSDTVGNWGTTYSDTIYAGASLIDSITKGIPRRCTFDDQGDNGYIYYVTDVTDQDCSSTFPCICKKSDRRQLEAPVERTVRFRMKSSPSSGRELQAADDEDFTAGGEFSVKVIISSGGFSLGGVGASLVMMMGLVVVTLL